MRFRRCIAPGTREVCLFLHVVLISARRVNLSHIIAISEKAKQCSNPRRPALTTEGVSRSSRHVVRDAMDAAARRRCAHVRTVKPCGPDPPTLGSSEWRSIDDGG